MRKFNPYLNFSGKCREALAFYAAALKGEIANLMTGADSGQDMPEENKKNVLHSEFKAEGVFFMASDGRSGEEILPSSQITLSLQFSDVEEQTQVFNALAEGGQVIQPLMDAFWGGKFGILKDRYGIQWMLNGITGQ